MRHPFLTARWLNLAMFTYRLDPEMLSRFVPPDCELDLIDGHAFASLVAFDFADTRVLGIRWPGFVNFPEVNLRFYVRHHGRTGDRRGICFIRELVAHRTVARIARWVYNEPFVVTPMHTFVEKNNQSITVRRTVTVDGRANTIEITGTIDTICPAANSTESFFKDQEWGFGTSRRNGLIDYKVTHPLWNIHPAISYKLDWDWLAIYGSMWAPLQQMQPISVMLVEGSAVKLFPYGTCSH